MICHFIKVVVYWSCGATSHFRKKPDLGHKSNYIAYKYIDVM